MREKTSNVGKCDECGRADVPRDSSHILFHYARCRRPCGGGPVRGLGKEDAPEGIHLKGTCPECERAAM